MSTETGQSCVQPLHERQRSSASNTSSSRQSSSSDPFSISQSVRARPRVVCFSSRVTMKLGHMTPPSLSVRRHLPIPTQRVVACENEPPSSGYVNHVLTLGGLKSVPSRRLSVIRYGSTTLPGFIFQSGSQIALNSRKPSTSSSPNIFGSSSARDWPSPCSPESEPPSESTRSEASSRNRRKVRIPSRVTRSQFQRAWMQPWP